MSDTLPSEQQSKAKPVLMMAAVIGALQVVLGGAALADFVSDEVIGIVQLVIAAIAIGYGIYTQGVVTPWQDVVAKATPSGMVVAGPASSSATGSEVTVVPPSGGAVPPPVPQ